MIYVDNASTMKMSESVLKAVLPYLCDKYGNASSSHLMGIEASKAIKHARDLILSLFNAENGKIVFTSGGSEANNQAIIAAAVKGKRRGKNRIVISNFEHDSVFYAAKRLENYGYEVAFVRVDNDGIVHPEDVEAALTDDTSLVSIMAVNNEIGTIQPIKEISRICRSKGVMFHTDAVQAVGHLPLDLTDAGVDLLTFSAHKYGGMKGVGGLYIRDGVSINRILFGGNQQYGLRAGSENVAGIVSAAYALEEALQDLDGKRTRIRHLRDRLAIALSDIPRIRINGCLDRRIEGNLNISVEGISSDLMLTLLDDAGICASSGAACHSAEGTPSRVLKAIGLDDDSAMSSVRFSLSNENTEEEIDYIAKTIKNTIQKNPR